MNRIGVIILGLLIFGGIINSYVHQPISPFEVEKKIKSADEVYRRGEESLVFLEKEKLFNEALKIYLELEDSYQPRYGNGKLYYNIGNSYYQLGQYPLALFYYYQALALMPRNQELKSNMQVVIAKLGLNAGLNGGVGDQLKGEDMSFLGLLSWNRWLSIPERIQIFFVLTLLIVLTGSYGIWNESVRAIKVVKLLGVLVLILLFNLFYHHYLSPIEGVVIESVPLRRDAGDYYAKVVDLPVLSGTKVEVLDLVEGKPWVKVMTPSDELGYLPERVVRLIP